ncbi:MAG: AMP-binding protein [Ilumatobacteraceae bacterium]
MAELLPWSDHLPADVDATALDLVAGRSLVDAWVERWAVAPDATALVDATSNGDGRTITNAELDERSALAARRLRAAGIAHGDRVLIAGTSSVDYVVAYLAILRAGATALAVNSSYTEREVRAIAADARPQAAISDQAMIRDAAAGVASTAFTADPSLAGLPGPDDTATIDTAGPGDGALLVYTSGTTGTPKGVPLSHANLLASAEAVRLAWRWQPDDRLVLALPLYHLHGLGVGLHGTLVTGASALLQDRFDPDAVIDAVAGGATMFFGVPTMWTRLAGNPRIEQLATMRLGVSGSAPLPADLHRRIAELVGRPPLERYGMSETAMLTSNPYDGERRAGSVGFPLPGVDVRLATGGDGPGEIEVRGPNVFTGYLDRPEATAEAFDGGWFRTGDLGEVDADGYLHIVGRSKELIISGGFNVFPREVEDVLRACPGVVDACVVGVPDAEWGERVTAFVVGEPDDTTLVAWAAERLVAYKRPRRWERIDDVPRNSMGKVQRDVLVRRATGT